MRSLAYATGLGILVALCLVSFLPLENACQSLRAKLLAGLALVLLILVAVLLIDVIGR